LGETAVGEDALAAARLRRVWGEGLEAEEEAEELLGLRPLCFARPRLPDLASADRVVCLPRPCSRGEALAVCLEAAGALPEDAPLGVRAEGGEAALGEAALSAALAAAVRPKRTILK